MFYPKAPLTKAQFVTTVVRAVGGSVLDETVSPWWANYHSYALAQGWISESDPYSLDAPVSRRDAATIIYRARQG